MLDRVFGNTLLFSIAVSLYTNLDSLSKLNSATFLVLFYKVVSRVANLVASLPETFVYL